MQNRDVPNGVPKTAETPSHHSISREASAEPTPTSNAPPDSMEDNGISNGITEMAQTPSHPSASRERSPPPAPAMVVLPDSRESTPTRDTTLENAEPVVGARLPNGCVSIPPHLRIPVAPAVNLASSRWNTSPQKIAQTARASPAEYPFYATSRSPARGPANGFHVGPHGAFGREQVGVSPRERAQDDTLALRQTISRLSQRLQDMQRKESALRAEIVKEVQSATDEALDDILKDILHRRMDLIKLDAMIKMEQVDLERRESAIKQNELFLAEGMKQLWYGLDAQGIRKTSELELNAARKAGEAEVSAHYRRADINLTAKVQNLQNREAYIQSRESQMAINVRVSIEKEVCDRLQASITASVSKTAYEQGFKEGKEVGHQEAVDEARVRGFDDGYKEARRTVKMLTALGKGEIRGDSEELEFLVDFDHPQNPFNRGLGIGQRNWENHGLGIFVKGAPITQNQSAPTGQAQMQTHRLPAQPDQGPSHVQQGITNGICVATRGLASGAVRNGIPNMGTFSREARAAADSGGRGILSGVADELQVNGHRPATRSAPPTPVQETVYSQILNSAPAIAAGNSTYCNGVSKLGVGSGKVYFNMTYGVPKNTNDNTAVVYPSRKFRRYTPYSDDADDDSDEEEVEIKEAEDNDKPEKGAGPKEPTSTVSNLIDLE